MQYVKIPAERKNILLGESGETKNRIQKETKTTISVEETTVTIDGNAVDEWRAADIVKAIGRGFEPEIALKLTSDNMRLEIIQLKDHISSKSERKTKKGRVIGTEGKMRRYIESLADVYISVYGNTVGIIGPYECVDIAREAVMMLIRGAKHSSVNRFLEKSRHNIMKPHTVDYENYCGQ